MAAERARSLFESLVSWIRPAGAVAALALLAVRPGLAAEARLTAPGAPDDVLDALRRASVTLQTVGIADATPQDIVAAARADYALLLKELYAQGYYGPEIRIGVDGTEAAELSPFGLPARIRRVDIRVRTGPPFTFARAEIAPVAPGTDLPEEYRRGARARSTAIRSAAQAGVEGWRDAGHAKAALADQSLTADHASATLDAALRLSPGPAVRFGELILRGESAVREERIRAIAGFPAGAPFDPEALERTAERLRRTGAFRSVQVSEAEALRPDGSMDVTLRVIDERPRRLGIGAELETPDGLTLSGFWLHRNLLGGGERLRFGAEISGIGGSDSGDEDFELTARFDRPAFLGADNGFFVDAALARNDGTGYVEDIGRIGAGVTRIFSDALSGEAGIMLSYANVRDGLGERDLVHLLVPAALTWDRRDDRLDPREGFFVRATATPLFALSDAADSGGRLTADSRAYRPLGDRLVVAGRLQFGSVLGADAEGVPPTMLFFSGGGGTVRGQPYESLGVDLGNGEVIGGRSFLGLSGEARIGVTERIGLVAFADAGFIGPDSWIEDGEWQSGAGLGLRYETGIGPIRVDIAAPVSGDTGDGPQIYIGIGQAF